MVVLRNALAHVLHLIQGVGLTSIFLVTLLCLVPQFILTSLSGQRWSLGVPFSSFILIISDHVQIRFSWGVFANVLFWLGMIQLLFFFHFKKASSCSRVVRRRVRIILGVILLLSCMHFPGIIGGMLELAMAKTQRREAIIFLMVLFFAILPAGIFLLVFSYFNYLGHKRRLVIGVALSVFTIATSWFFGWSRINPAHIISIIEDDTSVSAAKVRDQPNNQ
jgi:hypothetical protein